MDVGFLFALLMILWGLSIIGAWANWPGPWVHGSAVLQWVLFALLGYRVFGALIH